MQNLRTSFKKELNAQKGVSGQGATRKRKKYEFYDQLLFLIPSTEERPTISNVCNTNEAAVRNSLDLDSIQTDSSKPSHLTPTNRNKGKQCNSYEERLIKILKHKANDEIDEDKQFLLSLAPSLKGIVVKN